MRDWLVAIVGGAVGGFVASVAYTVVGDRWRHHQRAKWWHEAKRPNGQGRSGEMPPRPPVSHWKTRG